MNESDRLPSSEALEHIDRLDARNWRIRLAAAEALAESGDTRALEPLCILLKDHDPTVRTSAATALGKLGDARAVEPLSIAFQDDYFYVRSAAAAALGQVGDTRAVDILSNGFTDQDPHIRKSVVKALGQIRNARTFDVLYGGLSDTDPDVRKGIVEALAQTEGDLRLVEALCVALTDTDWSVRAAAARALGDFGDLRAIEPLVAAFQSHDRHLSSDMAQGLWKIGNASVLPLRILSSTILTSAQKTNSLQGLIQLSHTISFKDGPKHVIRYPLGNLQNFCQDLYDRTGTEESVKLGARAVLVELQNRDDASMLLRAGTRNELREQGELLRPSSNQFTATPSGELLRPSETSPELPVRMKPGILSRIFKRK
ncbi:MAG: lyase domain protein repeat-containing protein [Chthonomonadales bacterium]|nr:lyase domain protein repeat-containing protein [Chthonomonadales bacterium]